MKTQSNMMCWRPQSDESYVCFETFRFMLTGSKVRPRCFFLFFFHAHRISGEWPLSIVRYKASMWTLQPGEVVLFCAGNT